LVAALAGVGGSARDSFAMQRFDFDQRYFIQPGFVVKDHTLVQAPDDSLHLFYIKANDTLPESQRAKALGHAVSTDLAHWSFRPDVIRVVPNTWEESFVWAPHIVQEDGLYFMFYTGVNRHYAQAIGVAASFDLYHWIKYLENPVYTPSTSWASWNSSTWSNCRDPFVFQDAGTWYMLTTAWTNTSKGALSLASSVDLVHWTDRGPLLVHPGPQAWHVLESSNLIHYGGSYHLFTTEQNIGGSTYMRASSLFGPWDYPTREPLDAGHAGEIYYAKGKWMLSRHTTFTFQNTTRYTIKFDDLDWNTTSKPIVKATDPLAGWTVYGGDAFYLQPTFWDNAAARGAVACNFGGNSWVGTYELYTGPLQVGYPGLAAGEEPKGTMRSPAFTLAGDRISFRLGGGNDLARLYVALYTKDDMRMQLRTTGAGTDAMQTVVWNVSAWHGRPVFLEIADQSAGTMGHIDVDEIVEWQSDPVTGTGDLQAPRAIALYQNVPNPFNPSTRISLDLPAAGSARLEVFDARGRLVRGLIDGRLEAGSHVVLWNGKRQDGEPVSSGVYFYRLQVDGGPPLSHSMLLVK
jgi:hypothetical protein